MVEILSSSTEERDRGAKRQLYARYGVRHYWIVEPASCSLSEYVLSGSAYALRGTTAAPTSLATLLFPDLSIALSTVFG